MLALRSCAVTMFLLALCSCLVFLSVDAEDINPETYCHTCLLVAKEFNKALQAPSARRRRFEIDDLIIDVDVCNRLQSSKNFTKAQLRAACEKLFDSHYDDIYAAFVYVKKSRADLLLCYEKSDACVGVREPEKDKGADDMRSVGAKLKKKQAQRNLGVPMRHAERHPAGRPYENRAFEDDECLVVMEHNANSSDTRARPPGLSLVTVQMEPTCEAARSVTVETYPEPVVDTQIDHGEEEETDGEEKASSPHSAPSLQLTEEEWPSMAADNQSLCQDTLPPPSSFPTPSPPDTGLRSSLTLRGAEALAAPLHHSLSVSHGGAPLMISHHVSVGHATVSVDVHFYPTAATMVGAGASAATSTLDNKQENDKGRLHQSK